MKLIKAIIEANQRALRSDKFTGVKFEKLLEQVPALRRAMSKDSDSSSKG